MVESQRELICRFRPDGTHLFANEAYCRFFGLDPATVVGSPFAAGGAGGGGSGAPGVLPVFSPSAPDGTIEHRVVGGRRLDPLAPVADRAFFDEEGAVEEFQSVGRDVTERKEAEAALAALTAELERRVEERTAELEAANRDLEGRTPTSVPRTATWSRSRTRSRTTSARPSGRSTGTSAS